MTPLSTTLSEYVCTLPPQLSTTEVVLAACALFNNTLLWQYSHTVCNSIICSLNILMYSKSSSFYPNSERAKVKDPQLNV
jgi:hypothetical protein